jgi:hypothetical protein
MESEQDRVRRILQEQLQEAIERRKLAFLALQRTILYPSGLPHPEGIQQTHNASREYAKARRNVTGAIRRKSDYIITGITPEDLS